MAQELAYRMKREGEDEALFKLWSLHGGWGPTNPELWNYLMLRAPIVVAENPESGELLGQLAFLPALVSIRGRRVRALRAFAAILATKARQNRTLNLSSHPIADMYRFGLENLRPQGYRLVYFLPNPSWIAAFRTSPAYLRHSFPLWKLALPSPRTLRMPAGYGAMPLQKWDERVDELQSATSRRHRCVICRTATGWRHRAEIFGMQATAV